MERALAWLGNAVLTAGLVARRLVISLRNNWGIGLLSVVLALSLWVYVTDRENPERTGQVPGTVPIDWVNTPPGLALSPPCERAVAVRARASESVLERLTAGDFRATVDLSNVTGREDTVEVRVESEEPRAEVAGVSPRQVQVRLEDAGSRSVPVRVATLGSPLSGFEEQGITVEPEEAVVTGPQSQVSRVEKVEADVNLTGVRTDFERTLLLQARVGAGLLECVDVEPESVLVRVAITQLEFSGSFIVRPDVSGVPAEGYNVTAIQVEPPIVVISGSAKVFDSIDPIEGILTEAVSIDGATADVVHTVPLQLPEGARADPSEVTVRISIAPGQGQSSFSVVLQVANLASGLNVTLVQTTVQVVLAGAMPDLGAIDAEDIEATLDLGSLEAGEHTVPVRVQVPQGTAVVAVVPVEVRVRLRSP